MPKLAEELAAFDAFGTSTTIGTIEVRAGDGERVSVDAFTNEFWTSRQRAANRLHEVSYRACFKPQLPRFFIERLTDPGDVVYDPFMGRGTAPLEAALLGRTPFGCDVNPLSEILVRPRLEPPRLEEVTRRLSEIDFGSPGDGAGSVGGGLRSAGDGTRSAGGGLRSAGDEDAIAEDLLVFYHPETLRELRSLRAHLLERSAAGTLDAVDRWIRMVAVNRLTGHSAGFFSVYTMPPNQAVSVESQRRINTRLGQSPPRKHVPELIVKKTRSLLSGVGEAERQTLTRVSERSLLMSQPAETTPEVAGGSVRLVVTSPPFLDVVDYAKDNWLRCWFCGIRSGEVPMTIAHELGEWRGAMTRVFFELERVLAPGGHVAFEVGEVRSGTVRLEDAVLPCGLEAGLEPVLVLINDQEFTKTANCWGVSNSTKGTNTNRVVLFRKS